MLINNKLRLFFSFVLLAMMLQVSAQQAGQQSFTFLNHAASARIQALGGNMIGVKDDDIALAWQNPAALSAQSSGQISFNHHIFFAGVQHGYAAYAQHIPRINMTLHAGIKYVNYGEFAQNDEYGVNKGTFSASEQAFVIGAAKQLSANYSIGVNLKYIHSQLESYSANGLGADISAMYYNPDNRFGVSIVAQNVGRQLKTYLPNQTRYNLPSDIQIGISKRLKHLPFRFGITYQSLNRWNIRYDNQNKVVEETFIGATDNTPSATRVFADNLMRHFVFNGEFFLNKSENFRIRVGYNHRRRNELAVENYRSLGGFSFGVGLKINRFKIDYGRSIYSLAGAGNFLSLSTNIHEFKKKNNNVKP